jgi:hypothetical protein
VLARLAAIVADELRWTPSLTAPAAGRARAREHEHSSPNEIPAASAIFGRGSSV